MMNDLSVSITTDTFLVFCIAPGQAIVQIIAAVSDFTRRNT